MFILALAFVLAVFVVIDYVVRKFARWWFGDEGRPRN